MNSKVSPHPRAEDGAKRACFRKTRHDLAQCLMSSDSSVEDIEGKLAALVWAGMDLHGEEFFFGIFEPQLEARAIDTSGFCSFCNAHPPKAAVKRGACEECATSLEEDIDKLRDEPTTIA